jgi:1-deoxy-D-xylulose-5-phosphate reductoisomerase
MPERLALSEIAPLELAAIGSLRFEAPDLERFPALRLAADAARAGGTAPAALNAANEVAVAAFLAGRLGFPAIAAVVAEVLDAGEPLAGLDLGEIRAADAAARRAAEQRIAERAR